MVVVACVLEESVLSMCHVLAQLFSIRNVTELGQHSGFSLPCLSMTDSLYTCCNNFFFAKLTLKRTKGTVTLTQEKVRKLQAGSCVCSLTDIIWAPSEEGEKQQDTV